MKEMRNEMKEIGELKKQFTIPSLPSARLTINEKYLSTFKHTRVSSGVNNEKYVSPYKHKRVSSGATALRKTKSIASLSLGQHQ